MKLCRLILLALLFGVVSVFALTNDDLAGNYYRGAGTGYTFIFSWIAPEATQRSGKVASALTALHLDRGVCVAG